MSSTLYHRALSATAIGVTAFLLWATWPHATRVEIEPGGVAFEHRRFSRPSLGDTLYLDADANGKLSIVNHDTVTHHIGPFTVPAHSVRAFSIPQPGTYTASCSLHKDGQLTYIVR